jgi:hypothetical protein
VTEGTREQRRGVGELSARASPSASSSLRGGWLLLARMVWLAVALLSVGVLVHSIPSEFVRLRTACTDTVSCNWLVRLSAENAQQLRELGLSVNFFAAYFVTLEAAFTVVAPMVIGAVVFWRRSEDRMALLTSLVLLTYWTGIAFPFHLLELSYVWGLAAKVVVYVGLAAVMLFLYVFPDGHFVPRWARWLALASIVVLSPGTLFPYSSLSVFRYPLLYNLVSVGVVCAIVSVQVYRYKRVSDAAQRQQTKWVVLGIVALAAGYCIFLVLNLLQSGVVASLVGYTAGLLFLLFPVVSIVVAVLRYRLYDIDALINRTLVYGGLTVSLAAVYFGGVTATEAIFRTLTGQEQQPQLAIVVSTLVIAALFNPLRLRIQAFIDRRFYRRKYDARKTLEAFSAKLRDETDLDALSEDLVDVVRETMQPAHVSLWLRPDSAPRRSKGLE